MRVPAREGHRGADGAIAYVVRVREEHGCIAAAPGDPGGSASAGGGRGGTAAGEATAAAERRHRRALRARCTPPPPRSPRRSRPAQVAAGDRLARRRAARARPDARSACSPRPTGRSRVAAARGRGRPAHRRRARRSRSCADLPLAACVPRAARPLFAAASCALARPRAIRSASPRRRARALAALPLEAGERVLGAVGIELAAPLVVRRGGARVPPGLRARLRAGARARAPLRGGARGAARGAARGGGGRRAVELEEQLVGIVGHDLRTPLAAIRMSAAVLLRRGGLAEDQRRTLVAHRRRPRRAWRASSATSSTSRASATRATIPIHARPADLVQVAERAVAELAEAHPGREIRARRAGGRRPSRPTPTGSAR